MDADNGPSANGPNGDRDAQGRFAKGWKGGPGNPHAKKVGQLRSALLDAITPADLKAILAKLISQAKAGDVQAAGLLLDRLFGKPKLPIEATLPPEITLTPEQRARAARMVARADAIFDDHICAKCGEEKRARSDDQ